MTNIEELSTRTVRDEHLEGYAELYELLKRGSRQDVDKVAKALESHAKHTGLPAPAGRGMPSVFDKIVDFLSRRHYLRDLGTHPAEVTWMELHVPRDGSCGLNWSTSTSDEASFTLSLLGSGFGSGRKVSWVIESDIPARSTCLKFIQQVEVHVHLYAVAEKGKERHEPSVDVVATRSRKLLPWPDCPYCAQTIEDVDEFEYERGEMIDLRTYDAKYKEIFTRSLTKPHNASLGLSLPSLAHIAETANLSIAFNRETQVSCKLVYEFAKGRCYQPYWRAGESPNIPYWSST